MPTDKKFELGDYVEVKDRIKLFYELYGQGRLVTSKVKMLTAPDGKQRVMVQAKAYRNPDDRLPGIGTSWMDLPGTTSFTRGSEVENAETSAWGRAIGSLGILIDRSIATQNEIDNKADDKMPAAPRPLKEVKPHDPGKSLIGTAELGKEGSGVDFTVGEDGRLSFRLTQGKTSYKVVAFGDLAAALALVRDDVLGLRVKVWGTMEQEAFVRPHKETVWFPVVHLSRIETPDFTLPAASVPTGDPVPLFDDEPPDDVDLLR